MSSHFATYPSLKGRKVLITGGATGIGAAFVREFHQQGSKVAFLDIDCSAGEKLGKSLRTGAHFFNCDVTNTELVKEVVGTVERTLGGVDVLINNAAHDKHHEFLKTTEAEWDQLISVNLKHQFFVAQSVIPIMKKNIDPVGGVIINMSSICYMGTFTQFPVYMIAKAAIQGLTQTLGRELGPFKIRTMHKPDPQAREYGPMTPEQEVQMLVGQCIQEKLLPEHIARMALFLASDDARMITKQKFIVDGGFV